MSENWSASGKMPTATTSSEVSFPAPALVEELRQTQPSAAKLRMELVAAEELERSVVIAAEVRLADVARPSTSPIPASLLGEDAGGRSQRGRAKECNQPLLRHRSFT